MENVENLASSAPPVDKFNNSDYFLQILVKACNTSDLSLSITLNVRGLLVSGDLIGGEQYFDCFASDMKDAGMSAEDADLFKKLGGIYTKQKEQIKDKKYDETAPPPQYIHLKNAQICLPGGSPIPTNRGVWWRGRLEAIDGFHLGKLSF